MHHFLLISIIVMICTAALISIAQLWFIIMTWDVFFKTLITLGILTVLAGLVLVVKSDLGTHKKMKDENYLD